MKRDYFFYFLIISVGILFISRLFYLQILDNSYQKLSNSNAIKIKYEYPERGYIYDRNGKLLVANQPSYDIMVVPREVKVLDTLEFCNLLKINKQNFIKRLAKASHYSTRIPSVFLKQVSKNDFAYLQEKMFKYKGFYIQKRMIRSYPINSAANVLGYIGEISEQELKKNTYYHQGELVGKQGVEKQYEFYLRGIKGVKYIQRNRFNKEIGPYKNGKFDTIPTPGKDLTLTIDIDLQQYGEKLMNHKRGAIVAIEPSTGEILALVTAPSYNPNLMVGRNRSKNFTKLYLDSINKPLFDRGLQAQYAPGSTFKLINGLIGLQEQVITPQTVFYCYGGFQYGKRKNAYMKCHCGTFGPLQLNKAIYRSCNTYFSNVYLKVMEKYKSPSISMDAWNKDVESFGLGHYLGYDLPSGKKGLVPDANYYNKYYPNGRWRGATTISNAIGQGEILTTPIQLANMTSAIANRGYYITPHVAKKIQGVSLDKDYLTPKKTLIDKKYFKYAIKGMYDVFEKGTAKSSRVKGIKICGKTGTVENFKRINGKRIQFADHSIFIAFAPKDKPKIALAVFVENGSWGSRWAAPIASLMIEKYLKGTTSRPRLEKAMMNGSLEGEYQKDQNLINKIEKTKK